ncbi:hypothetical protein NXF88_28335, partial [Klebsiella pneumoniae]|nr:hypothetical protein [Klebsiella pneumoniae]MDS6809995.1 hypothetical protein [Klebsiella pneumoniae]
QTETEATGAPQKHHYTLNQQVGSITLFCAAYKKKKKNNKQIIKSSTLNPALNPPPREIKSIFGIKNIT